MNSTEQRLKDLVNSRTTNNKLVEKRREVINKCKESISKKFYNQMEVIKSRGVVDKTYTNKLEREDTERLILFTQSQLDKLKINGKYYENKVEEKEDDVLEI